MKPKEVITYVAILIVLSILTACLGGCKSVFVEMGYGVDKVTNVVTLPPDTAEPPQPPAPPETPEVPDAPEPPEPPETNPPDINTLTNRRGGGGGGTDDRQRSCCNRHLINQLAPLDDYSFALFANNKFGEVQITPSRLENKRHIKIEVDSAKSFAKINTYFFTDSAGKINIGEDVNGNRLIHFNSVQGMNPPNNNMLFNFYSHENVSGDSISVGLHLSRAFPISQRQSGIVSFKGAMHKFSANMNLENEIDFANHKISDIEFNYDFATALASNKTNSRHKIEVHNLSQIKLGELDLNGELFNRFDTFNNVDSPSKFISSDESVVSSFTISGGGIYGRSSNELFGAVGYDENHVYTIVGD